MSKNNFSTQLQDGRGNVYFYAKEDGSVPCKETLLKACLESQVYSTQSEGTRGKWLYDILCYSGLSEAFFEQISTKFLEINNEDDESLSQLFDLMTCYAVRGEKFAQKGVVERMKKLTQVKL